MRKVYTQEWEWLRIRSNDDYDGVKQVPSPYKQQTLMLTENNLDERSIVLDKQDASLIRRSLSNDNIPMMIIGYRKWFKFASIRNVAAFRVQRVLFKTLEKFVHKHIKL